MRRIFTSIILFSVFGVVIWLAAFAGAQNDDGDIPIPPATINMNEIAGAARYVRVEAELVPQADISSIPGTDSCTDATVSFPFDYESGILELGSPTDVSSFTIDGSDPSLASCIDGSYSSSQGYRSAWFKIVAPVDGRLIVEAATNSDYKRNFDTVIAIFSDSLGDNSCSALTQLSCNDDSNGVLSKVSTAVTYNSTYYILAVDRNAASSGQALLDIDVTIDTGSPIGDNDSNLGNPNGDWYVSPTILDEPTSRHTVVISGTDAYIIGGQIEAVGSDSAIRTGATYRFDTTTEEWVELATMTASAGFSGQGYSNADAMVVGDEIHFYSGYIGSPSEYLNEHWIYNVISNTWDTYAEVYPSASTLSETVGSIEPLAYTALTSYESGNSEGFYVTGGLAGVPLSSFTPLTDTVAPSARFFRYSYNVVSGGDPAWAEFTSMNRARYGHTAARIEHPTDGTLVCVVGGLGISTSTGTENVVIDDGECFPETGISWDSNYVDGLNYPRYYAHSAVSADGTWYIYGGYGTDQEPVPFVEAFDASSGTWSVMGPNYNLDGPELGWVRGGFVDANLWIFGGEQFGNLAVGEIKAKTFPYTFTATDFVYLPFITNSGAGNSFATAVSLDLDTDYTESFSGIGDVYNVYRFETSSAGTYSLDITNQSNSADADFLLYDSNKNVVSLSQEIGSADENLSLPLDANETYYILVARSSPPPNLSPVGSFTIRVSSP